MKSPPDRDVRGFDTETLNGYCRLLCDDKGRVLETDNLDEVLRFLTARGYRETHNFFYNMRFDAQAILKYLPRDVLDDLYHYNKVHYDGYTIKYIPKKVLVFAKSKHSYAYYDVAQFFGRSLEYNAEVYLKEKKNPDGLDRAKIGTSARYWDDHHDEIVKYCILDAELCRRLGVHLHETMTEEIGITPWRYVSKAGISKDYFRAHCDFPHTLDIPKPVMSMYLQAYAGGRFEVLIKGRSMNCHSVDICSAYPKQIARLPDLRGGEWRKTKDVHEKALIGVYFARCHIPPMRVAPLPVRLSEALIVYPVGDFYTYMTKQEYEAFSDTIDIEVMRGWEYYDRALKRPFEAQVTQLYRKKAETKKKDFKYSLIKIILNSLYGSFYEKVKQDNKLYVGKMFNPVYATEVTAGTRAELWRVLNPYRNDIVSVATDGVVLKEKPDLPYSNDLGAWDYEGGGDAVVIRSGLYRIGDKMKNRGLKSMSRLKTPHGSYADIFEYIQENPTLQQYPITIERPLGMGECLVHTKTKTPEMINTWAKMEYTLDINTDLKRIWDDQYSQGGEIFSRSISSRPLILA